MSLKWQDKVLLSERVIIVNEGLIHVWYQCYVENKTMVGVVFSFFILPVCSYAVLSSREGFLRTMNFMSKGLPSLLVNPLYSDSYNLQFIRIMSSYLLCICWMFVVGNLGSKRRMTKCRCLISQYNKCFHKNQLPNTEFNDISYIGILSLTYRPIL